MHKSLYRKDEDYSKRISIPVARVGQGARILPRCQNIHPYGYRARIPPLLPEIATVPEYTPLLPGLAMVPTVTWSAAPELVDAGTDAASTSSELGPGGLRGYVRGQ